MKKGPMQGDHEEKLKKLALDKALEQELRKAIDYCKATIQVGEWMKPSGVSTAGTSMSVDQVRTRLAAMTGKDSGQVVFGGCLGQLDLEHRINDFSAMDLGRMRWAAARLDQEGKFSKLTPILVRLDSKLQHVERDADLVALSRAARARASGYHLSEKTRHSLGPNLGAPAR